MVRVRVTCSVGECIVSVSGALVSVSGASVGVSGALMSEWCIGGCE